MCPRRLCGLHWSLDSPGGHRPTHIVKFFIRDCGEGKTRVADWSCRQSYAFRCRETCRVVRIGYTDRDSIPGEPKLIGLGERITEPRPKSTHVVIIPWAHAHLLVCWPGGWYIYIPSLVPVDGNSSGICLAVYLSPTSVSRYVPSSPSTAFQPSV